MNYQVSFQLTDEFLEVEVVGEYSPQNMFELIGRVRSECDSRNVERVMIDCSSITGSMTEAERFAGGKQIAEVIGPSIKTALVMPLGQVTKLGELTAVNRGAVLLVTDDPNEAAEWLITDE